MDIRSKLIALWWADYIYREIHNKQACFNQKWLTQAFYFGGVGSD